MLIFLGISLIIFVIVMFILNVTEVVRSEESKPDRYGYQLKAHPPILTMWADWKKTMSAIIVGFVLISFNNSLIFAKEGHVYYVLTPFGKRYSIDKPGFTFVMPLSKVDEWSKYIDIKAVPTDGNGSFIESIDGIEGIIPDGVKVMFIDRAMANVYLSVRFELPSVEEEFIKLVETYRTPENLINNTLLPTINEQLTNVSYMYSADEYVSGGASDYKATIEDALKNGGFVVKRTDVTDTIYAPEILTVDSLVNKPRKIQEIRTFTKNIKVIDNGIPKRIAHEINTNKVITASVIVSDVELESSFMTKLQQQRDISVEKIIEIQKIETAAAARQRIIAEGERDKAEERVTQEKAQVAKLITIETQVKEEESRRQLAEIAVKTAELEAKAVKIEADAISYKNRQLVSAGLTPLEKANIEKEIAIGVARELKELKLPSTYINGGSGSSSQNGLLESLIGADLARKMMNK